MSEVSIASDKSQTSISEMDVSMDIFVISKIPNIKQTIKDQAPKGVHIIGIDMPDDLYPDYKFNNDDVERLKDAKFVIGDPAIVAENIDSLPNLEWLHSTFAGVDTLMKVLNERPPFVITRHSGTNFCSLVAEYVVAQIINSERKLSCLWRNQNEKIWGNSECYSHFRPLNELSISILGTGNMGSAVAEFLHQRGATIFGFSRSGAQKKHFYYVSKDLETVVLHGDYVVNTLPSTKQTRGLLKSEVFKDCFKFPVFVNVGRGDVIKEKDLLFALKSGWLSGAILDVFENEPLPKDSPLWTMQNVIITPHVSAPSQPKHVAKEFFRVLKNYLNGDDLYNRVSWDAGY